MNEIIFISFYTNDPIYDKHAKDIKLSLDKFNLQYDIECIKSDPNNTWIYNTIYKPKYIFEKLNQYSCPLVWLDIDSRVKKYPELFFKCNKDIAVYSRKPAETSDLYVRKLGDISGIRTGTIYLDNNQIVKNFVNQWYVICKSNVIRDHIGFNKLFKQKKEISIEILPVTYCYIFDIDKKRSENNNWPDLPVIEHLQASRQRKKIDRLRNNLIRERKSRRYKNLKDKHEYRTWGIKRSGHHAILHWIMSHFTNKSYINDILGNTAFKLYKNTPFPVKIQQSNNHFYNIEDGNFQNISDRFTRMQELGLCNLTDNLVDIIIIRDIFNLIASRIASAFNMKIDIINLYKQYAKEFLRQTQFLKDPVLINYNTWFISRKYRQSILDRLNIRYSDKSDEYIQKIAEEGKGSSFDQMKYNTKAQDMKVLDRWKYFKNNEKYINYFNDKELLDLTCQIFGEIEAYQYIKQKLKDFSKPVEVERN